LFDEEVEKEDLPKFNVPKKKGLKGLVFID